ncbi:hypothetical protein [Cupriavidus sp. BIS7]|jgi:hypothetical protein|nr:hypothetical protein [Cupriavidus sp. BIS7]
MQKALIRFLEDYDLQGKVMTRIFKGYLVVYAAWVGWGIYLKHGL